MNRGYTGHEHLDAFGIINMNGRVYDPLTAQFFSPDPFVQSPGNWQNFNRYAYCMNNPVMYTDPSGYQYDFVSPESTEIMQTEMAGNRNTGFRENFGAWSAQFKGAITYNDVDGKYYYSNGDVASWDATKNQLISGTNSEDIQIYSGINLGYDHLYTITIGGVIRLAGSINGEITGIKNGFFTVTNNAISAVLAADGELSVYGKNKTVNTTEQSSSGWLDQIQTGLDVAGIADPTGIVDGVNALIYAGRGQWGNAAISALAIIPYGDIGKAGRLAGKISIKTASGIEIKGFAKHGLDRVIERGVTPNSILDAIKNPLKKGNVVTDQFGRQSQRFIGRYSEVVINPNTGLIISVNATSSSKAAKLINK